jgi:hypothetical protein
MKKTGIILAILAVALVGIVAAILYAGDVSVSTSIMNNGAISCTSPQKPYTVAFGMTNSNTANSTTINVTAYYNVTDDGALTTSGVKTRTLAVGGKYSWNVVLCTQGNQTNHTIVSRVDNWDITDTNTANNHATATQVI